MFGRGMILGLREKRIESREKRRKKNRE